MTLSQVWRIDIGALGMLFLLATEQKGNIIPNEKWGKNDLQSPSILREDILVFLQHYFSFLKR